MYQSLSRFVGSHLSSSMLYFGTVRIYILVREKNPKFRLFRSPPAETLLSKFETLLALLQKLFQLQPKSGSVHNFQ